VNTGRKARLGLSGLVIAGMAAAALAAVSHAGASSSAQTALSGPQPGAPLDHFVCYHVRQAAGSPPIPASVLLGDEFSAKNPDGSPIPTPVKVGAPTALCAPVTKYHQVGSTLYVYPVVHSTLHLVCFKITESTPTPRMFVSTDNQFNPPGQKRILETGLPGTNVTAQSVCLPSHKSVDPAAPPQGEPLGLLSHFKCYTATETEPTGQTVPGLPAKVWAQDQFSPTPIPQISVNKVISLCNPAVKVVPGPNPQTFPEVNPDLHLVCFSISGGVTTVNKSVTVDNQFNPTGKFRTLAVLKAYALCAPSFKAIIAPPPG